MPSIDFPHVNALAYKALTGDAQAREELLAAGYPYVRQIIARKGYFAPGGSNADLVQEGMRGYWEAVESWRPELRNRFLDWAVICVEREVITGVKTATRLKHGPLNDAASLDAPAHTERHSGEGEGQDRLSYWRLSDPSGLAVDPLEILAERSEGGSLVDVLCECMPAELERQVFALCMLQGKSYREAAVLLGKHDKSVDNALQRIRRKLMNRAAQLASDERISAGARAICARVAAGGGTQRRRIAS